MQEIKKVVVIGPESTGKSTLCESLAKHYHTLWCPEYAREYLLQHGTAYTFDDLLTIAQGQLTLQEKYVHKVALQQSKDEAQPLLFLDTDMYVMKVWCEYVFYQCHYFILEKLAEQKADLYLLCNIDLPWVKDELREYPDLQSRMELYNIYKDLMVNQPVPWIDITGNYDERFTTAVKVVNTLLGIH